jgi:hypothetical protein
MVRPENGAPESGAEVEGSVTPDSSASRGIERHYPFPAAPSILRAVSVPSVVPAQPLASRDGLAAVI